MNDHTLLVTLHKISIGTEMRAYKRNQDCTKRLHIWHIIKLHSVKNNHHLFYVAPLEMVVNINRHSNEKHAVIQLSSFELL